MDFAIDMRGKQFTDNSIYLSIFLIPKRMKNDDFSTGHRALNIQAEESSRQLELYI